jgi:glycosyltransferase involved in cell wall biosynthesis
MFGLRGLRPDLEITGFETSFAEIAPRLVDRGHEVTIYCRRGAHSPARRVASEDGVALRYMPAPGGKNFAALTSTWFAMAHAFVRSNFDVWFFVNVGMGHHSAIARLSGKPVVMNVDGLDWERAKWGPIARGYFRSAARSAVRWCSELVTDADAMRDYYRDRFGRDSRMIAYGASVEVSSSPERLAEMNLAPRDYYLVVSRLIPENSLEVMLDGFRRSATTRRLIVVGAANYRDAFHTRLREIGDSDDRIELVGQISDQHLLKELWCNCYAYLHGHSVGGTNPALLRAMGYGSCVLARDTVFNAEVLGTPNGAGLLFANDAESVAALIDRVDTHADLAQRHRELAPQRIAERYTWERIVDEYEALFLDVTGARAARSDVVRR